MSPPARPTRIAIGVAILLVFTLSAGCATRSRMYASNDIATAEFAIRDAHASGAETFALPILKKAEMLVAEAKQVGGDEAERLAERALANALLANTIAQRESARRQLADAKRMDREAEALKERTTQAVEERIQ